jgi:heptosyltransferase-3
MTEVKRVLIHRLGSLGDTLVTLPVFHLVDRLWPEAEKRVLTNFPVAAKAPPLQDVLGDAGFADGYFAYPVGLRNPAALWSLAGEIRRWGPDVAVYANICRSLGVVLRDRAFLKLCGAGRIHGLPLAASARTYLRDSDTGLWEREAARIARALAPMGDADVADPANRSLRLTAADHAGAETALAGWPGAGRFIAISFGTKWPENDWGDGNWQSMLATLGSGAPGLGLVALGAAEDRARSDGLLGGWPGPALNLCGTIAPRTAAAVLERARCFAGHDSGPMHLSAAAGTPAVAVFSRKNPPGIWFPLGGEHRVFYPGLAWSGGAPSVLRDADGETEIGSIPAAQVAEACLGFAGGEVQGRVI